MDLQLWLESSWGLQNRRSFVPLEGLSILAFSNKNISKPCNDRNVDWIRKVHFVCDWQLFVNAVKLFTYVLTYLLAWALIALMHSNSASVPVSSHIIEQLNFLQCILYMHMLIFFSWLTALKSSWYDFGTLCSWIILWRWFDTASSL